MNHFPPLTFLKKKEKKKRSIWLCLFDAYMFRQQQKNTSTLQLLSTLLCQPDMASYKQLL